ncbi:MAG: hypothetical protein Q7S46_04260 [Gallionella sp.]|nr:hypothetical protein [Gallionella sp.]
MTYTLLENHLFSGDRINRMKPPRKPWEDFPNVLIHASESAVKQHPHYWAAKTGDAVAA